MKYITIFESFASFEENQNILEFLDKDSTIYESSLSRMWQYVEGDKSFGIISPFRKSDSKSENILILFRIGRFLSRDVVLNLLINFTFF